MFQGELGLQFTLQVASHYSTGELVELADMAARHGFQQISFAKLGLDYAETIRFLSSEIVLRLQ